jgi:transposase
MERANQETAFRCRMARRRGRRSETAELDAINWRAELAIRFGVILRKVWGGSRTWPGARAQSILMSVWRTCWQQGRSALDFLSQLLRGTPIPLALPP